MGFVWVGIHNPILHTLYICTEYIPYHRVLTLHRVLCTYHRQHTECSELSSTRYPKFDSELSHRQTRRSIDPLQRKTVDRGSTIRQCSLFSLSLFSLSLTYSLSHALFLSPCQSAMRIRWSCDTPLTQPGISSVLKALASCSDPQDIPYIRSN